MPALSLKGMITSKATQELDIKGPGIASLFRASQELQLVQKETLGLKPEERGHQVSLTTTLQTVIDDVSKFETLLPVIITGLEQNVKCLKQVALPVSFPNGELSHLIEKF